MMIKIFLLFVLVSTVVGFDLDTDTTALTELYQWTNGPTEWKNKTGWGTDASVCSWKGIGCGNVDDVMRVIQLNLWGNGLHGSLPDSFSNLDALEDLVLSYNQIGGAFASGPFPRIKWLEIDHNVFSGPLTLQRSDSTLRKLLLGHNFFTGKVDPNLVAGVDWCDLSYNKFTCPIKGNDKCSTESACVH